MPQNPFNKLATPGAQAPARKRKSRNPFDELQALAPAPPPQAPAPPPEEPPGFFENIGIGAHRAVLSAADAGRVINEAVSAAASGDFEPLKQLAETVGRGVVPFAAAAANPQTPGPSFLLSREAQAGRIGELARQREERISQIPELYSSEVVDAETRAELARRAGLDPSIIGKTTRGVSEFATGAIPAVATGIATGGSVPAVATVVGLQSLGQPENLVPTVALAATPLPIGKAIAPLIRRLRGGRVPVVEPVIEPVSTPESPTALPGPAGPALPVRRAPANIPGPEAPGPPTPTPLSPAPAFPGTRPGNLPGPGGPRRGIPPTENPFTAIETAPNIPAAAAEQSPALRSAIDKLGTDDVNQIGAMIENSNRRFGLKRTPAEIESSMEDFKIVSQLTADEERALAQVLPARTVSPIEPIPGPSGAGQSRAISDIPMTEANAQLDANLRELEAFFGAQAGQAEPRALAMAVGRDAFDGAKVKVEDLGLPSKTAPVEAPDAIPVARMVKAEDLTLGRDDLSKGRMFQVQENLNEGLKPGGTEFKTPGGRKGIVTDIRVIPDPAEPGKFIVGGDGNHRVAALKLGGYTGDIPIVSMESPAQTAAMQLKGVALNEFEVAASRGAKVAEVRGPKIQADYALKAGTAVAPAEKAEIGETLISLWKAGLLTRVNSVLRNIGGTGLFQMAEQAARVPGSIADIVRAAFTGRRTVGGPNLASLFRGEAAKKGITDAIQILRKGLTAEQAAKMQVTRELASGNRVIDAYVNGVFRFYGAQDQFIRSMALRSALEERVKVQVLNEIRQGVTSAGDRAVRIAELIKNPDNALAAAAAADAEVAVFTNDNIISSGIGKAKQSLGQSGKMSGRFAKAALEVALPFDRTPTNIIARMLDYSPVGLARGGYGVARGIAGKAFTPAEERAFAQLFGRGTIGTGLIVLGWKLGEAGLATGMFEDEPGKSARDVAAGRPPGALRIGDSWHQIIGFAPLGNLVALGASLNREFEESREEGEKSAPSAIGDVLQETAMQQPLLQAAQGLTQKGSLTERLGRLASSAIPGGVQDIGEMFDVRRSAKGEGFLGQIAARTPIARNYLSPPAVDALGRPLEDRFTRFIDPTLTSTAKEAREPLIQELIRLDVGLPKIQRKPGETSDQYLTRIRRFGELYQDYGIQLMGSGAFQSLTDQVKLRAFDALSRRAQAQVAEEFETRRKGPVKSPTLRLNPAEVIQSALKSKD